ncbi:MAG: hypothetical protein CHACPFDD_01734 [Phycisphaerae bacterium]|nr:hypothetical protein [Phycisphaerae bacterium]
MLELAAIGVLSGVIGGLMGIGGGLVMIPAMLLVVGEPFGPGSLHVFKLAALLTSVVLSVPAAWRHLRKRAVVGGIVRAVIPGALGGVAIGTAVSSLFAAEQTHILRRSFGVFMMLVVAIRVYQGSAHRRLREACPTPRRVMPYTLIIGAPSGVIAGLLGVGGGVWAVPAQNVAMGVELRHAIANSTWMIVFVAVAASGSQAWAVSNMAGLSVTQGLMLSACMAPGALLGGWVGADLVHKLPARVLSAVANVMLLAVGLRLALG